MDNGVTHRRKILFIGINQRYINATNALLPAMMQRFYDVHFYGPGYVGQSLLDQGIDRYVETLGDIDFIVVTVQCVTKMDIARLTRYLTRYTTVFNDGRLRPEFLREVEDFCKRHRQRVICAMSEMDPHVTPQAMLDSVYEHAAYFMAWGDGFLNAGGDAEWVGKEEYIQRKLKKGFQLGLLDAFARQHADKFINLGHFVGDNEFYWGSLSARRYDVAVPGSRYARRREIMDGLKKFKDLHIASAAYQYPFKAADRLGLRPFANFYVVHLYNLAFQKLMSGSKCCITDGGANNYPVRKFFEIPAAGAVMICWPAVGMELLGFEDGNNCIFIRGDQDIVDKVRSIAREPERFGHIAAAGRELVLRQHSVAARAAQFREAAEAICAGTFNGSGWRAGQFVCDSKSRSPVHTPIQSSGLKQR